MGYSLKQVIGAAVVDMPLFEYRLRSSWLYIRNRRERLQASSDGRGVSCDWHWTSDLYAPKVFPALGVRLMERCLQDWPIEFDSAPRASGAGVRLSFIIGHRGPERVAQLLTTLSTIAAQRDVACECIVVEQSNENVLAKILPSWVRYVHTPLPDPAMPYCRSWALNVGARAASGELLVFHDNDMLVPQAYATELSARAREGSEVINLKRFIFYLNEAHSGAICAGNRRLSAMPAEAIVQNLEAGGSVAMTRDAFFSIGGFDESFVGWGGEDNEFWQRALTRKLWPYAYLPIVHLWHAPQREKTKQEKASIARFSELATIPPARRIEELAQRGFGDPRRMDPPWRGAQA